MADLTAKSPCAGLLPVTIGSTTLSEVEPGHMTSVTAVKGGAGALSAALQAAHGVAMPAPNRTEGQGQAQAVWFGPDQAMLIGPAPDATLAAHASLVDQSDGWAVVDLTGAGAADVLARLTTIDLRDGVFAVGHTARTDLMHMMSSITRTGADSYRIMVFRAFARTLVHDLTTAMTSVHARVIA